jgi:hypothetical protein
MTDRYVLYFDTVRSDPTNRRYQIAIVCVIALHAWIFLVLIRHTDVSFGHSPADSLLVELRSSHDGEMHTPVAPRRTDQSKELKKLFPHELCQQV